MKLADRVAIVTGGASGIGAATAKLFAQEGALVIIADIREELGQATAESIKEVGQTASFVKTDVSQEKDVVHLVEETLEAFGRLDIVFSNAGVLHVANLWDLPREQWDHLMAVNLTGAYLVAKHSIHPMMETGGGSIIFTASNLAFIGLETFSAYCATKGGLVALTRALALECGPHDIRVNAICPGSIRTSMQDTLLRQFEDPETVLREAAADIPVRRLGTPQDISQLALYLASTDSAFVTGAAFVIDGGASAR